MTQQEIENIHHIAEQCINDAEINDAFVHISTLVGLQGRGELSDELDRTKVSYSFMLRYLEQGVLDPQREEILSSIRQSLYTLNDQCYISLMEATNPGVFYARRRELSGVSLVGLVEEYQESLRELALVQNLPNEQYDSHAIL